MGAITYWDKEGLYINLTNWCSNNCVFCFRNFQKGKYNYKGYNLELTREPSEKEIFEGILRKSCNKKFKEIVYCGIGEPLYRLDSIILTLTPKLKKIFSKPVRINTNGRAKLLFPGRNIPKELSDAGIDKISISLNAENFWVYNKICRPKYITHIMDASVYSNVCHFIGDCVKQSGLELTISVLEFSKGVLSRDIPVPDVKECEEIAKDLGVKLIIRKYYGPNLKLNR